MKRYSLFFAAAALVVAGCQRQFEPMPEPEVPQAVTEGLAAQGCVRGVMNVYLSDELADLVEQDLAEGNMNTKSKALNDVTESLGATRMRRLFPDAGEYEPRTRKEGLHRWYVVEFDETKSLTKASEELKSLPGIEIVEKVPQMKLTSFNDPYFERQWDLYNNGKLSPDHKQGCDINVQPVWDNFTTGNPNVIVSVVDGGIDQDHEDLKANCIGGYNFVDEMVRIIPHSHGTHVGGTIAAVSNNGKGVSGIAGGNSKAGEKGVSLLSCQVFVDEDGATYSGGFDEAIKWAADHGAVISQNSWGRDYSEYGDRAYEVARQEAKNGIEKEAPSLKAAIDYFIKYAGCDNNGNQKADSPMKGGVFIMAAGNSNWDVDVYCEYDPVVSVGAVTPDFIKAYYSNYGDWVDICAPGGDYRYSYGEIYNTYPGSAYGYMQGTSMACPHVSGVAALLVSYYGGKGFTNKDLKEKLLGGANANAVKPALEIGPLLDAMGSMTYGGVIPPEPVQSYTATVNSNNARLEWKVTQGKDGNKAHGYLLVAARDKSLLSGLDPKTVPDGVVTESVPTGSVSVGSKMSGTIRDLEFSTKYYVGIFGYNFNGYYSAMSPVQEVTTGINHAPEIAPLSQAEVKVKSFETATLQYRFSDVDEHDVTLSFEDNSGAVRGEVVSDGLYQISIKGLTPDPGVYNVVITASDKYGMSASYTQKFEILENHAPEIVKQLDNQLYNRIGQKAAFNMAEYIKDPDGEIPTYNVKVSNQNNLKISVDGNTFSVQIINYGDTKVTMTAVDAKGKSCVLEFIILTLDPDIPIETYPNPVVNTLNVRVHSIVNNMKYSLVSSTGTVLVSGEGPATPFEPMTFDFTGYAPGKYVFTTDMDGEKIQRTIIKQ